MSMAVAMIPIATKAPVNVSIMRRTVKLIDVEISERRSKTASVIGTQ